VPVVDGIVSSSNTGLASWSVSSTGVLAYVPGRAYTQVNPVDWMPRGEAAVTPLRATPADWESPSFSPDGKRLAMDISDGKQRDIYLDEWAADRLTQLTFDASDEQAPVFSPDGRRITFASDRAVTGTHNLYAINADGTGALQRLTDSPADQRPGGWDPSGRYLVFAEATAEGGSRVMVRPPEGPPVVFADDGGSPSFSADGRWIAYHSRGAVYVRPFPGPGGQWKIVAPDGVGIFPRFSPNGHELVFLTGASVVVVPYTVTGDEFRPGSVATWSPHPYQLQGLRSTPFAIHPDGERLAILAHREAASGTLDHVVLDLGFFDELRRLLPVEGRR
jgi:dipeptidyl aminopeptidase/acylaminoacyl peptidase